MLELVQKAQAGDPSARDELLAVLRPQLRAWVEQALSHRFAGKIDVSDVTQETLLEIALKIESFLGSTEREFLGWVRRGLDNDIRDVIRKATAQRRDIDRERSLDDTHGGGQALASNLDSDFSTPSQQAMRNEQARLLHAAIQKLPPDQAQAIRMVHIDHVPLADAAQRMERSYDAMLKLLQRGMVALRKHLPRQDRP